MFIVYAASRLFAASFVYSSSDESIEFINRLTPVPHVRDAKASIIPTFGFLIEYLKNNATRGINTIKAISPIMLASINNRDNIHVTLNLLALCVSKAKKDCKNPLLSIMPIPISMISSVASGANAAKFAAVVLNISFKPDKLNREVTATVVLSNVPRNVLIIL